MAQIKTHQGQLTDAQIAKVAHEVNRAYSRTLGDESHLPWDEAPDWQKESIIAGVKMHRENPNATPRDSNESWMSKKLEDGWKLGPEKDAEKKEHPCMLPYDELPAEQRGKDDIFVAMVKTMLGFTVEVEQEVPEVAKDTDTPQVSSEGAKVSDRINDMMPLAQSPAAARRMRDTANYLKTLGQ